MDFETLKQSSSNFDKLTKAIEANLNPEDKEKNKSKYQDDRFWKPELDKTGNGFAVIRFLPAPEGEDLPWQRVWSHAFQDVGGWYIENSLTTLGQKDPVSEENTRLWNTGVDSDKEIARKRKRKLSYYSNILVVSDPKHPENEQRICLCHGLCDQPWQCLGKRSLYLMHSSTGRRYVHASCPSRSFVFGGSVHTKKMD